MSRLASISKSFTTSSRKEKRIWGRHFKDLIAIHCPKSMNKLTRDTTQYPCISRRHLSRQGASNPHTRCQYCSMQVKELLAYHIKCILSHKPKLTHTCTKPTECYQCTQWFRSRNLKITTSQLIDSEGSYFRSDRMLVSLPESVQRLKRYWGNALVCVTTAERWLQNRWEGAAECQYMTGKGKKCRVANNNKKKKANLTKFYELKSKQMNWIIFKTHK